MPDLAAAELSIPAEQIPDPAKPLVVPVDTTVVSSELLYSAFHSMADSGQSSPTQPRRSSSRDASVVGPDSSVGAAISGFLPFVELEPATAPYFERLSVLQLSISAASWRRVLGALADLGVFGAVHIHICG